MVFEVSPESLQASVAHAGILVLLLLPHAAGLRNKSFLNGRRRGKSIARSNSLVYHVCAVHNGAINVTVEPSVSTFFRILEIIERAG